MKSKRLLAALLCVMMMLTIMPVLNVAATTYAFSDIVGNGSVTYAEWDLTKGESGRPSKFTASTAADDTTVLYNSDGAKVIAASANYKDYIITYDSRPFQAQRGIIFTAKMEGSECLKIRAGSSYGSTGRVYIDGSPNGWGLGETFVPGNDWVTYVVKVNETQDGILMYGTKDADPFSATAVWTYIGGRTFNGVGTTNNFTMSCGYDGGKGEATDGVCISYFASIDNINANYVAESDLIPSDWTATTDMNFENASYTWPSDSFLKMANPGAFSDASATDNYVKATANGLEVCQHLTNQFFDFRIKTSDNSDMVSANRLVKWRMSMPVGNVILFHGTSAGCIRLDSRSNFTVGKGWYDYILKLNEDGTTAELYARADGEELYNMISTYACSSSLNTNRNKYELWFSSGYNGANKTSQLLISDIEVYEYQAPVTTLADLVPAAWGNASHTFDFKNANFDWEDSAYDGFSATTSTGTAGSVTYNADGVKICQDPTNQFSDFVINLVSGHNPISANRIMTARAKVVTGKIYFMLGNSAVTPAMNYEVSAAAYGTDWVNFLFKVNEAQNGIEVWTKSDSDAGYTLKETVTATRNKSTSAMTFSCGYNGSGNSSEAWISDIALYTNPSAGLQEGSTKMTQEEILGSTYVSDSVDLTQCTGAANDEMVSGQGVTAAKDGVVTYDATNGATVWTTADNYTAKVYGDWEWTNASWLPFSDTYKAIKMVAKAGDNAEIQIRAGRGTQKGVFVNIASTMVAVRKPVSGFVTDTHNYDFGTGFNEILIVPGEDGYALWVRPEGSTDKYTQVFADAAYYTDGRATFYAGNYKTGSISIKSVEALVGERAGSNILGTNATILENIPLKGNIKASGEIAKYRFAGTSENTWEYSETDGLTFYDDDTENAGTKYVAACYDYSALGGTKALKFTATMEEGGDLKLRIGASGKRAYANMTPSTVEIYSGTSSTPIVAKGVDGNNFAPGTTAQTYLIKTEGNGYAMYVQTDAVNDKWLMIAEADWWRNDGGQMKFETNSGKKVTLKDIVVYETATMAPVTLLDGYTATYVENGGALADLNNRTVRAIVNPTANGKLVFAGYDADGKMVLANVYTVTAGTQEEKFFAAPKSNANIKTVKVFLWDDFEKMNSQYDMTAVTTR